jgi:hypothetical protein
MLDNATQIGTYLRDHLSRIAGFIVASMREPEFTCGDCERNARCGLPPTPDCVVRAAQIERNGGQPIKRKRLIGF